MNEISNVTRKLLVLSMLKGVGPSTLRKLANLQNFTQLSQEELAFHSPLLLKALKIDGAWDKALQASEKQIVEAKNFDASILSPSDDGYPSLLSATRDDPFLIFVRGKFSKNPEKSIAIIGTREPTKHGELTVQRITQFFSEKQWSVVSGLALGCDAIAHRTALECNGHTVAVLAHGLQTVAPTQHSKLANKILTSGGALVSEYCFGKKAQPQQFVKRDRTQAGLAQGVVMIQSDLKGGSLHASRASLNYNRWLIVPYPTQLDRNNNESKVQANITIADGKEDEKTKLLNCSVASLKKIIILMGKEDYPDMLNKLLTSVPCSVSAQCSLL